jgi:hypothetical protein
MAKNETNTPNDVKIRPENEAQTVDQPISPAPVDNVISFDKAKSDKQAKQAAAEDKSPEPDCPFSRKKEEKGG